MNGIFRAVRDVVIYIHDNTAKNADVRQRVIRRNELCVFVRVDFLTSGGLMRRVYGVFPFGVASLDMSRWSIEKFFDEVIES